MLMSFGAVPLNSDHPRTLNKTFLETNGITIKNLYKDMHILFHIQLSSSTVPKK
jgi:hypothetical protein